MSETTTLVLLGAAGVLGLLLWPAIKPAGALTVLLSARVLSDVGAASTGSLLPSSTIAGGIAVAAIVAGLLPSPQRLPMALRRTILGAMSVLAVWTVIGVSQGMDISQSVEYLLRWTSYIAIGILGWRAAQQVGWLRPQYVATAIAFVGAAAGAILQLPFLVQDMGRVAGTFSHANTAGAFFGVSTVAALYGAISRTSRLAIWLVPASALGVIFTQSMGALIATGFACLCLVASMSTLSGARRFLVILVGCVASFVLMNYTNATARFAEFQDTDIASAVGTGVSANSLEWRFINWQYYLAKVAQSPILGYGLGSHESYTPLGAPPHSLPVQLLYDFGALGTLLILCLSAFALRKARRCGGPGFPLTLAILAFVLLNGFASNILGYTAAMYLAISSCLLAVSHDRSLRQGTAANASRVAA